MMAMAEWIPTANNFCKHSAKTVKRKNNEVFCLSCGYSALIKFVSIDENSIETEKVSNKSQTWMETNAFASQLQLLERVKIVKLSIFNNASLCSDFLL